jgi:anti-sigma-K factor RskA
MSEQEKLTEFERHTRAVLEASLSRVDGRIRSRLNQARQAAVDEAMRRGRAPFWRAFVLMPAVGAVAAALLGVMLLGYLPHHAAEPATDVRVEDMDLLADADGLDLVQSDGAFYEWAIAQTDGSQSGGTGT